MRACGTNWHASPTRGTLAAHKSAETLNINIPETHGNAARSGANQKSGLCKIEHDGGVRAFDPAAVLHSVEIERSEGRHVAGNGGSDTASAGLQNLLVTPLKLSIFAL